MPTTLCVYIGFEDHLSIFFSFLAAGINVLIVGAGGMGLWAVRLANYMLSQFSQTNIKLFVSDNSIDKLLTALDHNCYDVIHWNEEDHEQYIIERTLESCKGGVDVVIDLVSSPRTVHRTLKILNRVSKTKVSFDKFRLNNLKGFWGGLLHLDLYIVKLWNKFCLIELFVYVIH